MMTTHIAAKILTGLLMTALSLGATSAKADANWLKIKNPNSLKCDYVFDVVSVKLRAKVNGTIIYADPTEYDPRVITQWSARCDSAVVQANQDLALFTRKGAG